MVAEVTERDPGPDLPGDENFRPTIGGTFILHDLGRPAWADADTVSIEEQVAQHHNRLRYYELTKLRRGEVNQYRETRYR